jgi:hypothetical protein
MNRLTLVLLAAATIGLCQPAHARHHHYGHRLAVCTGWFCPGWGPSTTPAQRTHQRPALLAGGGMVDHPSGCPGRAFCGCGAAVRVFGTPRRDLWLASNWLRFPRAAPAPGMAAARRGHVMVLESHVGGSTWIVYDANSGGHATRVHARSITGYVIVNPRA